MIIGITGHARHGKDTTADVFVKHFGFTKMALAKTMKDAMAIVFGWGEEHLYGSLKDVEDPEYGISPREALQSFGTEWGQLELARHGRFAEVTGRKLWVKSLLKKVRGDTVICDVRFPHEVEEIRKAGGVIIKVRRPWEVNLSHVSESSITQITPDYVLENDGTIEELEVKVIALVKENLKN